MPSNRVSSILAAAVIVGSACSPSAADRNGNPDQMETPAVSDATLPANFPENFPLVPDFAITEARFTEGDAMTQANFLVRGTSAMSVLEIATFYHERLPALGFRVQGDPPTTRSDNALVYFASDDYQDCSVQLTAVGDRTNILISLPLRD